MKKIIMAVAAIAMAVSVFAVDFAANVHGWTDLFNMDIKDGAKPSFLGWRDPFDREYAWSSTGIGINFSGDKAGTSFELDKRDVTVKNLKTWIQPIDMLKITLGNGELAMPKETIDYDGTVAKFAYEGWYIDLMPISGLTISTGFETGEARNWGWAFYGEGGKVKNTTVKIAYGADWGTINALYNFGGSADKTHTIAGGYSGNFGGVGVTAGVSAAFKEKVDTVIKADLYVTAGIDAFGIKAYVNYISGGDGTLVARLMLTYGLGQFTPYLYFNDSNLLAKDFNMILRPGVTFNIGAASMDAGIQFLLNEDADRNIKVGTKNISIPVIYKLSF